MPPEMRPKKRQLRTAQARGGYTAPRREKAATPPQAHAPQPSPAAAVKKQPTDDTSRAAHASVRSKLLQAGAPTRNQPAATMTKPQSPAPKQSASAPGLLDRVRAWWQTHKPKEKPSAATPKSEKKSVAAMPARTVSKQIPTSTASKTQPAMQSAQTSVQPSGEKKQTPPAPAKKTAEQPEPAKKPEPKQDTSQQQKPAINTGEVAPFTGATTFGTNLMRGQEFQFFDWRRAAVIMGGTVMAVVVMAFGIRWFIQISGSAPQLSDVQGQLAERRDQVAQLTTELGTYTHIQEQAQWASDLLAQHVYWSNFFIYLEGYTIPGVWYEEFNGEIGSAYSLEAHAVDFDTFVEQLHVWKTNTQYTRFFTVPEVTLTDDATDTTVDFTVNFAVAPEIFRYQSR